MDDAEIKRLRREITRIFGSSPHKKKVWRELLDMYVEATESKGNGRERTPVSEGRQHGVRSRVR